MFHCICELSYGPNMSGGFFIKPWALILIEYACFIFQCSQKLVSLANGRKFIMSFFVKLCSHDFKLKTQDSAIISALDGTFASQLVIQHLTVFVTSE